METKVSTQEGLDENGVTMNKKDIALYYAQSQKYPTKENKFRPSQVYPEYPYKQDISMEQNDVYEAVRNSLNLLEMDVEHFGTSEWNPLGELISPGDKVLIKPNMVMDFNASGESCDCLYTQPGVVAAIIDYVVIALKGQGQIVVGDAPMQECKFEKLIDESGYQEMIDYYSDKGVDIKLVDFRELKTEVHMGARYQKISSDSRGTVIDLKDESEFNVYSAEQLERIRITNYTPERLISHHQPGKHEYYVSDYVLEADVVINISKPKTHRKAGVTIALKNLVGINVRKEYLPHHTKGSMDEKGDEYKKKSLLRHISSYMYDKKNFYEANEKYIRSRFCYTIAYALKVLTHYVYRDEMEGSWYGNHTISKTIVDLNKILLYADKEGKLHNQVQRKVLNVGDMIISGEKEGPVAPSPKPLGVIAMGINSVNFDKIVGTMMGADMSKLPVMQNAEKPQGKLSIKLQDEPCIISNDNKINGKIASELKKNDKWNFISTRGWRELFK